MSVRPFPAHMYRVPDPGDRRIAILTARVAELEDENAALKKRIEILEPPKLTAVFEPPVPALHKVKTPFRDRLKRGRP